MANIFLSYDREDVKQAKLLAEALESEGWSVFLDRSSLLTGQDFDCVIEDAIKRADCMIVVWSNASIKSSWVRGEATIGRERKILLPILLEPVDLPYAFQSLHTENFVGWQGDKKSSAFLALCKAIAALIRKAIVQETGTPSEIYRVTTPKPLRTTRTIQLPEIDWVEIPAGTFIYGEKPAEQTLTLERFFISRYPITNCQYQTFIDAGGYQDEQWWQDLIKPAPKSPTWPQANRPKENVNWFEALAFTRWLSVQLGYEITLPTEQQWEKAARGTDGRVYPWGNEFNSEFANCYVSSNEGSLNLNETTAVGLFLQSTSPYQVMDMAGNVLQWCLNKLERPEQTDPDHSADERVLRGGSWNNSPEKARSCFRYQHGTVGRQYGSLGFRVVSLFPYAEPLKFEQSAFNNLM